MMCDRNIFFFNAFFIIEMSFTSCFQVHQQQESEMNYAVNLSSTSDSFMYLPIIEEENDVTSTTEIAFDDNFYGESLTTNGEKYNGHTGESLIKNDEILQNYVYLYESTTDYRTEEQSSTIEINFSEQTPDFDDTKRDINNEACETYTNGTEIDIDSMVDIWQAVYYNMPEDIFCFKMIIKNIFPHERNKLRHIYGEVNQTVDWSQCQLEILGTTFINRRHFLQSIGGTDGVFENIIIEPDEFGQYTIITQPPDQWRLIGNLLMMRDCESDGIVVFAKIPVKLEYNVLKKALRSFGVDDINEEGLCEDQKSPEKPQNHYKGELMDNSNYKIIRTSENNMVGYFR